MTEHDKPTATEMASAEPAPIPVCWVSRDDLLWSQPELAQRIGALTEDEVETIAEKIGDALHETYWLALRIAVEGYFIEAEV